LSRLPPALARGLHACMWSATAAVLLNLKFKHFIIYHLTNMASLTENFDALKECSIFANLEFSYHLLEARRVVNDHYIPCHSHLCLTDGD